MTTLAGRLAEYAHALRFEELPAAAVHEVKRRVIDALACAMGAIGSEPGEAARSSERPGLLAALVSIYGLTMTNPMTILSFAGLFAALGLAGTGGVEAATLTAGVLVGSGLWWLVLTTAVGLLRTRVTLRGLTWVNRASGALLVVFGAAAVAGGLVTQAGG